MTKIGYYSFHINFHYKFMRIQSIHFNTCYEPPVESIFIHPRALSNSLEYNSRDHFNHVCIYTSFVLYRRMIYTSWMITRTFYALYSFDYFRFGCSSNNQSVCSRDVHYSQAQSSISWKSAIHKSVRYYTYFNYYFSF